LIKILKQNEIVPGDLVIVNRSMYYGEKEIFEITTNDSKTHWKFGEFFLGLTQEQLKLEQLVKLNESIKVFIQV